MASEGSSLATWLNCIFRLFVLRVTASVSMSMEGVFVNLLFGFLQVFQSGLQSINLARQSLHVCSLLSVVFSGLLCSLQAV